MIRLFLANQGRRKMRVFGRFFSCILAAWCVVGAPSAATACSFAHTGKEVSYAPGDAALGAANAKSVVDWFIGWRDGIGIGEVLIATRSVDKDNASIKLSAERAERVKELLQPLTRGSIPIEVFHRNDAPAIGVLAFVTDMVVVSVVPACFKTDSCCPQVNAL